MPTSQEDLQAKSEEVQELRDQVANAEYERRAREAELSNEVAMKQLEAEEAMLRARLQVAENANSSEVVESGANTPLAAAQADMERAVAMQEAVKTANEYAESSDADADDDSANEEGQ